MWQLPSHHLLSRHLSHHLLSRHLFHHLLSRHLFYHLMLSSISSYHHFNSSIASPHHFIYRIPSSIYHIIPSSIYLFHFIICITIISIQLKHIQQSKGLGRHWKECFFQLKWLLNDWLIHAKLALTTYRCYRHGMTPHCCTEQHVWSIHTHSVIDSHT